MTTPARTIREVLRQTPLDPAVRWTASRIRHYRRPKMVRMNRTYDLQTVEVLKRAPGNYLDIGASSGAILKRMLTISPDGHHVAFEAIPQMAARLRERFPDVEIHQVALSDSIGETRFHVVSNDMGRSGMRRIDYPEPPDIDEIVVRTDTVDNLVHHAVHGIKIDVEGAELQVLKGARRVLAEHRPFVVFEHGAAAKHYGTSPNDVFDLFADLGFGVHLMSAWLGRRRRALSRAAFFKEATTRNWYFVASPD